ncbi:hypothetical protein JCM11491_001244 [Sporobolomyces phaffii]
MPARKAPPGNPEWVQWVEELAQDADDKGKKSAASFKKAASALRSNPIPMSNPDEARQLVGIGDYIVKHIRREMEKQAKALGLPMPNLASPTNRRAPTSTAAANKKRSREEEEAVQDAIREARRAKTMGLVPPAHPAALAFQAHPDGAFAGLPEGIDDDGAGPGKGKGKAKAKAYIPKQRSGAYAILIAMYKLASYDEHSVSTLKNKIIDEARQYSNTSFDKATSNRGGQAIESEKATYTAWSGMGTLTAKNLVVAEPRKPPRFHLTEEGYQLAERLVETVDGVSKHVYIPSSSQGEGPSSSGLGRHPSSSGFSATNGVPLGAHPSSSGSGTGAFAGRGQTLGVRPASLHSDFLRRRSPTPPLFLESEPPRRDHAQNSDLTFEDDTRRAIELSRRESAGRREDPVARIARETAMRGTSGGAGGSAAFRPAGLSTSAGSLHGKRAALGNYASTVSAQAAVVQAPSIANVDGPFGYYYLDENDRRTNQREEAEICQPEGATETYYRIEYRTAQDLHKMVRGLHKPSNLVRRVPLPPKNTKSAYIKERVSNEIAPGFPESAFSTDGANAQPREKEKRPSDDPVAALLAGFKETGPRKSKDAMYQPPPEVRRLGAGAAPIPDLFGPVSHTLPASALATNAPSKRPLFLDEGDDDADDAAFDDVKRSRPGPTRPVATISPRPRTSPPTAAVRRLGPAALDPNPPTSSSSFSCHPLGRTSSQNPLLVSYDPVSAPAASGGATVINRHPLDPVRDHVPAAPVAFPPAIDRAATVWPAGSFEVYLICDTREGTREAGKRIELCAKMERRGIKVDRKMLPLGDMIWVARKKKNNKAPAGVEEEVVLDAIVERKRLDDLISSIQDGRYLGQKIRLKDSGISHRIYLIEKYGETNPNTTFGKAVWTCKSQLQVNDGFYVHESANIEDTINYLEKRTQIMAELYENEDLRIVPDSLIDRTTYLALQQHLRATYPQHRYLVTYADFAELNRADATLTLRVTWATMVQRVHGVSAEKAVQFLTRWPTLAQFWHEARAWERDVEAENRALDAAGERVAGGTAKGPKAKRRKVEDFVVANLEDVGTRGIKAKLGAKIWELFMTNGGKYTS